MPLEDVPNMPSEAVSVGCKKLLLSNGDVALSLDPMDCIPLESSGEICSVRCPAAKPTLGKVNWNLVPDSVVLLMLRGTLKGAAADERACWNELESVRMSELVLD
jgi:hypothetical protein